MSHRRISRRNLLMAGGTSALVGAVGLPAGLAPAHPAGSVPADDEDPVLDLHEIQGNVLGGFNKDLQHLLFLRFGRVHGARRWLAEVIGDVATSEEVLSFNDSFRSSRARRGSEAGAPTATWLNVAFTHAGLAALGVSPRELGSFPDAFRQGMAARADLLGDRGSSDPSGWVRPFARSGGVHAVLILASDRASDLRSALAMHRRRLVDQGIRVVSSQAGHTRPDQPGHEHFGFKDGISQPGIRGITARQNPADDGQGLPGQDLLWPGEFVLGYPTQIPRPSAQDAENEDPGPVSRSGPAWTANGSYLVFRRLRQDVAGFRRFVADAAAQQGMTPDQLGAKLVGRYPSGAPLALTGSRPEDPGGADPTLLDETRVNDFEFAEDDPEGLVVPRGAHIRKAYPRDDPTPTGAEADTQTHRILRRGIPYGPSYRSADAAADRGLLFLCYQADIERQFEFVQSRWVNDPDAPGPDSGHDPIISQLPGRRTFTLPGGRPDHLALLGRFVTTTAGAYFLSPSISALRRLSAVSRGELAPDPRPLGRGSGARTRRPPRPRPSRRRR